MTARLTISGCFPAILSPAILSRAIRGFACLLCVLLAPAALAAEPTDDRPVILAIGESTTEGYGVVEHLSYPAQLQALLDEHGHAWRVVNHGRSGSTTAMALSGLDRGLRAGPEIVLIALGGNDSGGRAANTRENLRKMVSVFIRAGATVFLADRGAATDGGNDEGPSLFAELAEEEGAILMPSLREGIAGRGEFLLMDGRHPNAEGYAIIARRIFGILEPWLDQG